MTVDLRGYLNDLRASHPHEVLEVGAPVSPAYEMTALALEAERRGLAPVLVFNAVSGHAAPVVSNLFASRPRIARMLGLEARGLVTDWAKAASKRLKPEPMSRDAAPVKQVVITGAQADASVLPIPTHFEADAGRYITAGVVVARDPETGASNLSFARMQLQGPRRFGVSMHSRGDLWDYHRRAAQRGQPLPIAVAIGLHPLITLSAAARLPSGDDELHLAGGLLGQPVPVVRAETADIGVPAHAELILEGVLLPDEHTDEGPFGEFTGYASGRSTRNIFEVSAITHREGMLYQDVVPGASAEHLNLSKVPRAGTTFELVKRRFPGVVDMNYPSSGVHYHCYVSMRKTMEGSARQLIMLMFGLEMFLKMVVVVDEDIDVYNEQAVMWALATRFQADRDLFIVPDVACNLLDPSATGGLSAKLGLDATQPMGAPERGLSFSSDIVNQARARIDAHMDRQAARDGAPETG